MAGQKINGTSIQRTQYQEAPTRLGWAVRVFAGLTALLLVATVIIAVLSPRWASDGYVLSLGRVARTSDSPLFMVEKTREARYLRGAVGTVHDGRDWRLETVEGHGLDIQPRQSDLPLHPTAAAYSYRDYDAATLQAYTPLEGFRYRQVPAGIPERVRLLAQRITEGIENPFDKARAIEAFLEKNYTYNLTFEPAPEGAEPNDWFLFNSKEGVCSNFASALVVLARASDLPARLGAGYFVGSGAGEQLVYEDQAHAWAEIGFQEVGWLVFDAT